MVMLSNTNCRWLNNINPRRGNAGFGRRVSDERPSKRVRNPILNDGGEMLGLGEGCRMKDLLREDEFEEEDEKAMSAKLLEWLKQKQDSESLCLEKKNA
nr:hypothetical protein [Tanacetum cinerariifolium]